VAQISLTIIPGERESFTGRRDEAPGFGQIDHSPQRARRNTQVVASEIPRPAGKSAGLRDDAFIPSRP